MKNIVVALIFFALLIGGTVWNTLAVSAECRALEAACDAFPSAHAEAPAEKEAALFRLSDAWEKARPLLYLSVMRGTVKEVEEELCRLQGAVLGGSPAEYEISLAHLRHLLTELQRTVLPDLSYIL